MTEYREDREDREDRPRRGSRRRCEVCNKKPLVIDYKNVDVLKRFLNEHGQIESARKIGCGAKCQRAITTAIKRARHMALLPYTSEHIRVSGVSVGRPMPQRR
ncbi:MAG: 30S ribosomal protein S18 [Chloroflexi bacterium]|nr:30S ribosomal protein S18 [Chloroflexota bacterium]